MSTTEDITMQTEEFDSDSSSDDDSDLDDAERKEAETRAEALEESISANKMDYDAHVELINLYKLLEDFDSLIAAYERFHQLYPLTPTLWLDWIKIEISIAKHNNQHDRVFTLFNKAVEDYMSVDLWVEFAQCSIGVTDLETTRSILERGLNTVGLDVTSASLLWDTLREFEFCQFAILPKDTEAYNLQVKKLNDIFKRQLAVPLLNMEDTYKEYQDWVTTLPEGSVDVKAVEWGYKKALKTLDIYKPFEEQLLVAKTDDEYYKIYKDYIKAVTDPSTIICLYERAAFKLCLNPNIWIDYLNFCFKLGDVAFKVCERALRNCPWSEELWIFNLRIHENLNKSYEEMLATFEKGIASIATTGLELWLSYLEYAYRSNQPIEKLDKLFDQARHNFTIETDPSFKISKWWATLLAKRGNMIQAKKIWKDILSLNENRNSATVWMEYINLEKQYGEANEIRSIFQRALFACTDWPQYIADQWLQHERCVGSLTDVMKCSDKCKEAIYKFEQKYSNYESNVGDSETPKQDIRGKKRKMAQGDVIEKKKMKPEAVPEEKVLPQVKKVVPRDPTKTVFVSNLHPSVTEDNLKKMFPNAVHIDIALDKKGNSRCFGYVHFSMEEETMTALARDREPLDGRPVFISNCKPDKSERKKVFNYATVEETKKLFVRGLPKHKTQQDVEEIFKPHGAIAVRLVYQKSGQSKGLAFVEFETDEAASECLKKTDQMVIDDHTINVAISAPPPKGSGSQLKESTEPARHSRSKLQMPLMVPRSLQVKNKESEPAVKPKSNADFRNLFLKK